MKVVLSFPPFSSFGLSDTSFQAGFGNIELCLITRPKISVPEQPLDFSCHSGLLVGKDPDTPVHSDNICSILNAAQDSCIVLL